MLWLAYSLFDLSYAVLDKSSMHGLQEKRPFDKLIAQDICTLFYKTKVYKNIKAQNR